MATGGSRKVVLLALASSAVIAAAKLAAALHTGSSAMLSAAMQSLVDTSSQALLLYGRGRTGNAAAAGHTAGQARELHFWGFVVAVLLFALGAGVAIHEGVDRLVNPRPIVLPEVSYVVLGIALLVAAASTWLAISGLDRQREDAPVLATLRAARDPSILIVLVESTAALAGAVIALAGIAASHLGGWPQGDGLASIAIGLMLGLVAALFAIELKGLLTGAGSSGAQQAGAVPAAGVVAATKAVAKAVDAEREAPRREDAPGKEVRGEPATARSAAPAAPAGTEPKPQLVARPPHAKKGRGKRRR